MLCRGTKSCFPLEAGSSISLACYPNWQLGILFGLRPKVLHMTAGCESPWSPVTWERWLKGWCAMCRAKSGGGLGRMGLHDNHTTQVGFLKRGSFAAQQGMWCLDEEPAASTEVKTEESGGCFGRAQQSCGIYWRLLRQRLLPNFCTITLSWPVCWKWECLKDIGRWVCKGCQWNCPCSQSLLMSFAWPVGSGRQFSRLWRCRKGPVAGSRLIETRATHRLCDVWSSWLCMDHCSAHGAPKAHECSSSVKPIRI